MPTLVVVESPNKIKSVQKYLGGGFRVVATVGHFRDLPEKELGVDTASMTPSYVALPGKESVVAKLREALQQCTDVLLATDADREGEAIAWHVAQVLKLRSPRRMRFKEITKSGLKAALAKAGPIDQNLVDAQQARRVLDRLVGYQVSPLLNSFGPSHSAGRVQSAALHIVVEREKARENFKPQSFWTVTTRYREGFNATAATLIQGKLVKAKFLSAAEAAKASAAAKAAATHRVEAVDVELSARAPKAPFTTSTLQQAASALLDLKPMETMALAQQLFELGAITYHRTDSVSLSEDAVKLARDFIAHEYPEALPAEPVRYRNSDETQGAHEAIRPTSMQLEGDVTLTEEQEQLYNLISRRFLACQCKPAGIEKTAVRLDAGGVKFLARGEVVRFPSFLRFLGKEDEETLATKHEVGSDEGDDAPLPALAREQLVTCKDVATKADATKALPRFTQATLVRELKRTGIGRPSTYATIPDVLFERRYLAEAKKAVYPTPRGRLADGAVGAAFPEVVAVDNTAKLEAQLDAVAAGKLRWREALTTWYSGFSSQLSRASSVLEAFARENSTLVDAAGEATKKLGKPCPKCGKELLLKAGAHGPFITCSGYPACTHRADPSEKPSLTKCPKCGGAMVERDGKFGRYAKCTAVGCTGVVDAAAVTQELCPRCGKPLKDKGSFLGCSGYPACGFTVDAKALATAKKLDTRCPKCRSMMVQRKGSKGPFLACTKYPECKHTEQLPEKPKRSPAKGADRV